MSHAAMIKPAIAKSKIIAEREGLEFYHGKPCKNCGSTIKLYHSGKCQLCSVIKTRQRYDSQ